MMSPTTLLRCIRKICSTHTRQDATEWKRELAKRAVENELQHALAVRHIMISGTSMQPTLSPGDCVEIQFSPKPELKRKCIIYFRRANHRVVHRFIWGLGPICVEKGDGNRSPRLCLRSAILGTATAIHLRE